MLSFLYARSCNKCTHTVSYFCCPTLLMVPNVPIRMLKVRAAHPFKKEQKKNEFNNFSPYRHINSFPTLCYSPQESTPGRIKIMPLWPNTRCQWSICYFFSSKITLTPPQFVCKLKVSAETSPITHFQSVDQYYTTFKIEIGHFNNQLHSLHNISQDILVLFENS